MSRKQVDCNVLSIQVLEVNAMNCKIFFRQNPQVACAISCGKSAFNIPEQCFIKYYPVYALAHLTMCRPTCRFDRRARFDLHISSSV